MRKSLKIAAVATVLFLALGAVVFVYANSQNRLAANEEQEQTMMRNMQTYFESNNGTMLGHMNRMQHMHESEFRCSEQFLENATLSTVQGTVVTQVKGMLVLNTDAGQVRIMLPEKWTVGSEVANRTALFNGTFASAGQNVTIKVIESTTFSNANFSLNVMMGYEAINVSDTHAYAVLPFNIQSNS